MCNVASPHKKKKKHKKEKLQVISISWMNGGLK